MHGVRADAPWCPWNIEFIRRINGLDDVDDVHRIVFDASYLVLGLGDVYLGAPVATPLDPRHRLVTTKYNPARTWTPENAVGIGGAYLCIYGMEGPGGYQFVGRTVQVWNRDAAARTSSRPWLLRPFDQLRFHPVTADELLDQRARQAAGELALRIETTTFRLADHRRFLADHADEIAAFRARQQAAFAAERAAWARAGESGAATMTTRPSSRRPRLDRIAADGRAASGSRWSTRRRAGAAAAAVDRAARRRRDAAAGRHHAGRQGQHRRRRPPDHGRLPGVRLPPTVDAAVVRALVGRRRRRRRQDQPGPVRHRTRRRALAVRRLPERPLARARRRRVEQRVGGRRRHRAGRPRPRHRHRRLGPGAGRVQRHRRAQADPGPDQHRRRGAGVPVARLRVGVRPRRRRGRRWPRRWPPGPTPPTRGAGAARSVDPPGPCPRAARRHPGRRGADFDGDPDGAGARFRRRSSGATGAGSSCGRRPRAVPRRRALLYGGAFVAERYEAVGRLRRRPPRRTSTPSSAPSSPRPASSRRGRCSGTRPSWPPATAHGAAWDDVDVLVVPTVPRVPTVAEVLAGAVGVNAMLGTYTNFVNLLDLCALTVPVDDAEHGQPPPSLTLIGPAWSETIVLGQPGAGGWGGTPAPPPP